MESAQVTGIHGISLDAHYLKNRLNSTLTGVFATLSENTRPSYFAPIERSGGRQYQNTSGKKMA